MTISITSGHMSKVEHCRNHALLSAEICYVPLANVDTGVEESNAMTHPE
ncbi:hypothetical protein [Rarobacter incanus]|nr:hypothetical protein [Rarobacter incanus]